MPGTSNELVWDVLAIRQRYLGLASQALTCHCFAIHRLAMRYAILNAENARAWLARSNEHVSDVLAIRQRYLGLASQALTCHCFASHRLAMRYATLNAENAPVPSTQRLCQ